MVTYVPDSFSRQLLSVLWLGTEALLFYSPLPGNSVTFLMGLRERVWPLASCDLLQEVHGLVTSQDQGSHVSTVATPSALCHPSNTVAQSFSRTTSATKGLCSSLWGGTNFNLFSLIPSTNGFGVYITFCSRKTTTVQKGKRAPACACTHMHRAGQRTQGFAFWVNSTESSNLSRDWAGQPLSTPRALYLICVTQSNSPA